MSSIFSFDVGGIKEHFNKWQSHFPVLNLLIRIFSSLNCVLRWADAGVDRCRRQFWLNHTDRITKALLTHNEKLFFFWFNIVCDVFSYGTVKKACSLDNDLENPLIKKATLTDSHSYQNIIISCLLGFKSFPQLFSLNLEIQFHNAITRISIEPLHLLHRVQGLTKNFIAFLKKKSCHLRNKEDSSKNKLCFPLFVFHK